MKRNLLKEFPEAIAPHEGIEIVVKVESFDVKRSQIMRFVRAGIVRCCSCENPATHIYWQDQEEWYERCDEHWTDDPQWTGSTRGGYPRLLGMPVIVDKARDWFAGLTPEQRTKIRFEVYDGTDYYKLMDDRFTHVEYAAGGTLEMGWVIKVYPLTNGNFAYEMEHRHLHEGGGTVHGYGVVGQWNTERTAIEAALGTDELQYVREKFDWSRVKQPEG